MITEVTAFRFLRMQQSDYPVYPHIFRVVYDESTLDESTLYVTVYQGLVNYLSVRPDGSTHSWCSATGLCLDHTVLFADVFMELLL